MKNYCNFKYVRQFFFVNSLLLVVSLTAIAQDQSKKAEQITYPPVPIPNTEMRSLYSKILDQEMILYIKLPASYLSNSQKVYQALYFTDGNRSFPMIADIESLYEVPRTADPEIFIISIAYKIRDMADWGAWRTRDLTPTNVPSLDTSWAKTLSGMTGRQFEIKSGGASKFLEFIVKEVFPFIESNYRVSPAGRGLGGYSYGGLFSLYVLFNHPELFTIYYAGSPSIDYDHGVLYNYEMQYASSHNDLNAKLFMSAGGSEDSVMVSNMKKMAVLLQSRNFPGLKVETHVFPDETHLSGYPASIMRAFRVLYNR